MISHREYTTLGAVKEVLNINNTTDDDLLERLIVASSSFINRLAGRELYYDTWVENIRASDTPEIILRRRPVDTVSEVYDLLDASIIAATNYVVQSDGSIYGEVLWPFKGYRRTGITQRGDYPTARETHRITYTAGYATPNHAFSEGSLTVVAQANLVDGETFTIDDGSNPAVVFEYDVTGDGVTAGNVAVDVSGDTSVAQVRSTTLVAINEAPLLDVEGVAGEAGVIELTHIHPGSLGNIALTETVADAGFLVSGMSGGNGGPNPLPGEIEQACIQLVVNFFRNKKRNPQIKRQHVLEAAVWYNDAGFKALIEELLRPYTRIPGA